MFDIDHCLFLDYSFSPVHVLILNWSSVLVSSMDFQVLFLYQRTRDLPSFQKYVTVFRLVCDPVEGVVYNVNVPDEDHGNSCSNPHSAMHSMFFCF